jgi:hypothetical protein
MVNKILNFTQQTKNSNHLMNFLKFLKSEIW